MLFFHIIKFYKFTYQQIQVQVVITHQSYIFSSKMLTKTKILSFMMLAGFILAYKIKRNNNKKFQVKKMPLVLDVLIVIFPPMMAIELIRAFYKYIKTKVNNQNKDKKQSQLQPIKNVQDVNNVKDVIEVDDINDNKDFKDLKDLKDNNEIKDVQEVQEIEDVRDVSQNQEQSNKNKSIISSSKAEEIQIFQPYSIHQDQDKPEDHETSQQIERIELNEQQLKQKQQFKQKLNQQLDQINSKISVVGYKQLLQMVTILQSTYNSNYPQQNKLIDKVLVTIYKKLVKMIQNLEYKGQQQSVLAYYYCSIVNLQIQLDEDIQQIERYKANIENIYGRSISTFFEEYITIFNNIALYYSNKRKYQQSITIFIQLQIIQQKYLAKRDSRNILVKNNLACNYCLTGQLKKGMHMFKQCLNEIDTDEPKNLKRLIIKNMKTYLPNGIQS